MGRCSAKRPELIRRYPKVNEGTLATRVHRLNERFWKLLRQVIAETVADPAQVEEELRYLAQLLAKR